MSLAFTDDSRKHNIKTWYSQIYENYTVVLCVGMFVGIITALSAFTYCGICFFGNRCNLEAVLVSATIGLTTVCCICVIAAVIYTLFSCLYQTYVDWKRNNEFQRLINSTSSVEYD